MADFASNGPISQPIKLDWTADWDVGGGMMWSYDNGLFFDPASIEDITFRLPVVANSIWGAS